MIAMALATWGPQWQGKKIRFFCDNKAVCHMLHFKNSRKPHLAALLHTLCTVSAVWLPYFCVPLAWGYKYAHRCIVTWLALAFL